MSQHSSLKGISLVVLLNCKIDTLSDGYLRLRRRLRKTTRQVFSFPSYVLPGYKILQLITHYSNSILSLSSPIRIFSLLRSFAPSLCRSSFVSSLLRSVVLSRCPAVVTSCSRAVVLLFYRYFLLSQQWLPKHHWYFMRFPACFLTDESSINMFGWCFFLPGRYCFLFGTYSPGFGRYFLMFQTYFFLFRGCSPIFRRCFRMLKLPEPDRWPVFFPLPDRKNLLRNRKKYRWKFFADL